LFSFLSLLFFSRRVLSAFFVSAAAAHAVSLPRHGVRFASVIFDVTGFFVLYIAT